MTEQQARARDALRGDPVSIVRQGLTCLYLLAIFRFCAKEVGVGGTPHPIHYLR